MTLGGPLAGRVALVTGAAGGLGTAIRERLRQSGASVIATDVAERPDDGTPDHWIHADLATRQGCEAALTETSAVADGKLDILVNNAGLQHVAPLHEFPDEQWERLIAVMLTAPFRLSKGLWPSLIASPAPRIINVASIHALVASPGKAAYVAAKHGLLGLTRVQALEGGPHGLAAVALCPGYVRTPLVEHQLAAQARTLGISVDEVLERVMLEPTAIRRLIEPDEIADHVAFLCGRAGRSVSGTALSIDGAWTAR